MWHKMIINLIIIFLIF